MQTELHDREFLPTQSGISGVAFGTASIVSRRPVCSVFP
jgi:hypothetical protein